MKGFVRFGLAAAFVLGSAAAQAAESHAQLGFASETEMQNYFTVSDVIVREEAPAGVHRFAGRLNGPAPAPAPAPAPGRTGGGLAGDIISVITDPMNMEAWVALGAKVWQVVVENKPVLTASTQRVHVLPMAQTDWQSMENWKGPAIKTYTIEAKNLMGMTVMSHTYSVTYNYGGQFNGKGSFLANATIIPTQVDVLWGFKLNSEVEVGQVVNTASKDNPVPGVDLQLKWRMESVLKASEGRDSFFLKGNGQSEFVNGGLARR